jgi:hypothetical protein
MGRFNQEMIDAGIMLAADGLYPSSKGTRVSFAGGKQTVIEAPFAQPHELIARSWMIDVASQEAAVDWARRVPFAEGEIEIRQVYEVTDFPPEILPPDDAAREQAWRDRQSDRRTALTQNTMLPQSPKRIPRCRCCKPAVNDPINRRSGRCS